MDLKNLLWRAAHTLWQTFSAVFFATLVLPDSLIDASGWTAAITAAGTAGLAAALSAIKTLISELLAAQANT